MAEYSSELDKITYAELALSLQNTIKNNLAHTKDQVIHVTQEDKNKWNQISDIPEATETKKGALTPQEKIKLKNIEERANNYTHPTSGVTAGQYIQVEVNAEGHVVAGHNPTKINTTCENADRLGTIPADSYAKVNSPSFLGIPLTTTPKPDAPSTQIVNIEYLNSQPTYIRQKTAPEKALSGKLWIGNNNCLNAYNNDGWESVFSEVALSINALNAAVDQPTSPNDYSGQLKFTGKRKITALNLTNIKTTTSEYATVIGMRADNKELAYEFICIDNYIYMRTGKGDTWNNAISIIKD